jgi:hypothetical protein
MAAVVGSVACGGDPKPTAGSSAIGGGQALSGEDAALEKTAKSLRLYWSEQGTLTTDSDSSSSANGTFAPAPGDGRDDGGKLGFHMYRFNNEDDASPTVTVTSPDFQPYLVIKQRDCSACMKVVAGVKVGAVWEIRNASPVYAELDGPTVLPHDGQYLELYVTSVDNLKASTDEKQIGRAVTKGSYRIQVQLE